MGTRSVLSRGLIRSPRNRPSSLPSLIAFSSEFIPQLLELRLISYMYIYIRVPGNGRSFLPEMRYFCRLTVHADLPAFKPAISRGKYLSLPSGVAFDARSLAAITAQRSARTARKFAQANNELCCSYGIRGGRDILRLRKR